MKKFLFILPIILFFTGCNNEEKQAQVFLDQARNLYENAEYSSAKQWLDSLKSQYPKQLGLQKKGLLLNRKIELKEQERNLIYCDSMLVVKQTEADSMKLLFVFEKDAQYDEVGKYIDKQQRIERNVQRSYIRSGVNELGEMYIASVYYGSSPLKHIQLRVSKKDDEYAETQSIPADGGANYSFIDLGMTTEVVTYQNGRDNGVVMFIYNNKDLPLKAEYMGGRKYSLTISSGDKNSLVKTVDFSTVLSDIKRLKEEKDKAAKRIEYLQAKLNSNTSEE